MLWLSNVMLPLDSAVLLALIALCFICWRLSVVIGKIETILAVQIRNLDRICGTE